MSYRETAARIRPADETRVREASAYHGTLTKPAGSLGELEALGARLAGMAGRCPPPIPRRKAVIVFAGDHGVVARGVSAYPQEVTRQMVLNFLRGGAAVNVLSRQAGARVVVVDAGVAGDLPPHESLIRGKIAPGTADMAAGPAMSRLQAEAALDLGIDVATAELSRGLDMLACGEMGIGNTTPATAIVSALTGRDPASLAGPGTGLATEAVHKKAELIAAALRLNAPDPRDGPDVLAKVGGFEIGAMAGAMLAGAAERIPVVVDGLIATSAALLAVVIAPATADYLVAGHRSAEPAHRFALEKLALTPLLDLGMRLGEGTGAVLAFGLVEAAALVMNEMATFAQAGVATAS